MSFALAIINSEHKHNKFEIHRIIYYFWMGRESIYEYKQITIPMIEVSFYYLLLPEGLYQVWYNNILVLHTIITSSSNNFWQWYAHFYLFDHFDSPTNIIFQLLHFQAVILVIERWFPINLIHCTVHNEVGGDAIGTYFLRQPWLIQKCKIFVIIYIH